MAGLLIRGLTKSAVERIDAQAAALGLSRNALLRRWLEGSGGVAADATVTAADWSRSAAALGDLADPEIMDAAWR